MKKKQFDPASSFNSWLYRIAYTSSLDLLRKRQLRDKLLAAGQADKVIVFAHKNVLYSISGNVTDAELKRLVDAFILA